MKRREPCYRLLHSIGSFQKGCVVRNTKEKYPNPENSHFAKIPTTSLSFIQSLVVAIILQLTGAPIRLV